MQKPYIHHLDAEMNRMLTAMKLHHPTFAIVSLLIPALLINLCCVTDSLSSTQPGAPAPGLELIRPSKDGTHFVHAESGLSLSGIFLLFDICFFSLLFHKFPKIINDSGGLENLVLEDKRNAI